MELDYHRDFITATDRTAAEVCNFLPTMAVLTEQFIGIIVYVRTITVSILNTVLQ